MPRLRPLLLTLLILLTQGCTHSQPPQPQGQATLLWISIDGLRGDLPSPESTPYLASLLSHSYYTRELQPIFPSLTFPSHTSEVTGVPASLHGIMSNTFYDPANLQQRYNMPEDPNLIQSEPVWLTAPRQHVRTAVHDWPLSSHQSQLPPGTVRSDYSSERYVSALTDLQRLSQVADTYSSDFTTHPNDPALRLLMGYVHAVDSAAHKYGPSAPETTKALHDTDEVLRTVILRVSATFDAHAKPDDSLYVLLTADHGMSEVTSTISIPTLLGDSLPKNATYTTSGPLANIYLDALPESDRAAVAKAILSHLAAAPQDHPSAQAWTRDTLPKEFSYNNPRAGDVIVMLPNHQTFRSGTRENVAAPKGMHGYPPTTTPEMAAFTLLCPLRGPHTLDKSINLGPLDSLRLHPTAAAILHITPAKSATAAPIPLP